MVQHGYSYKGGLDVDDGPWLRRNAMNDPLGEFHHKVKVSELRRTNRMKQAGATSQHPTLCQRTLAPSKRWHPGNGNIGYVKGCIFLKLCSGIILGKFFCSSNLGKL